MSLEPYDIPENHGTNKVTMPPQMVWLPIETAPPTSAHGRRVLITNGEVVTVGWYEKTYSNDARPWHAECEIDEDGYGWVGVGRLDPQPTHWMPLPEPPK